MLSDAARELLACHDEVRCADRARTGAIETLEQAAAIQDEIVAARVARGERCCGYKIGFTNRTIWDRYGVHHPIWGRMYKGSVQLLDSPRAVVDASAFTQPRLEPEIVVQMAKPPAAATPESVAASVAWIAHGFEVVQSHFTDWRFSGAESLAAQGLHGCLLVGPRIEPSQLRENIRASNVRNELPAMLAGVRLDLKRRGVPEVVDSGVGSNVLDGPLHAIAHLVTKLAERGVGLSAGDIITTGTITDAQPLVNGQHWMTELSQAGPLSNLTLDVIAAEPQTDSDVGRAQKR